MSRLIGVVGAGAMGKGICQLAASSGHQVIVFDKSADALEGLIPKIKGSFSRLEEKQIQTAEESNSILEKVSTTSDINQLAQCGLVIEAIVEDLDLKKAVFRDLDGLTSPDCILATNTSSLYVGQIASACKNSERVIGLHFFNPVSRMELVEVVKAVQSAESYLETAEQIMQSWGKTTVRVSDSPGFVVNRVARPFYSESLKIYEERLADFATIDWALKELGGFKMGPFELMDFIGHDVNLAATTTVFKALNNYVRFAPSAVQQKLVSEGKLGRKTGEGFYLYQEEAKKPEPEKDLELGNIILTRVVSLIVDEALILLDENIASSEDIDKAMLKGVNYPKGPISWGQELSYSKVKTTLENLLKEKSDERYRPSKKLISLC